MKYKRIALIGGSGFVGRHLTQHLSNLGYECRVLTRHSQRNRDLQVSAQVRQIDSYDLKTLSHALNDCDVVVNLIGILNPLSRKQSFHSVHVKLTETVIEACHKAGIKRLLHMSALQADQATGSSQYLRSKGEGENRAHTLGQPDIAVTSFRPSVIFGPDDSFLNRFAQLLKIPGPFPLACPNARFSPVYINDVVAAFAHALEDKSSIGQHFELCGPDTFTLGEIVRFVATQKKSQKIIIHLPDWASRLQARVLQFLPGKPFTPDNYLSLKTESICSSNGLALLGVKATPMMPVASKFLTDSESKTYLFNHLRRHSRR